MAVHHHQFLGFPGRHKQPAIRTERNHLRPHPGQLDLLARRRQNLIGRGVPAVRAQLTNCFSSALDGGPLGHALTTWGEPEHHHQENDQPEA